MNSIPCILIPLLVGLICAVLGYLLGSKFGGSQTDTAHSLQTDLDDCHKKAAQLEADYNALKESKHTDRIAFFEEAVTALPFNSAVALADYGKKVKQDDLKIIEGIGPKIEELFQAANITTWKTLSETAVEKCKQILNDAGARFQMHNPSTWPKQAQLAYEGKWKELKTLQDALDGGK